MFKDLIIVGASCFEREVVSLVCTSRAGGCQVKKADNGMMLNIGGRAMTNYVFIVGKE